MCIKSRQALRDGTVSRKYETRKKPKSGAGNARNGEITVWLVLRFTSRVSTDSSLSAVPIWTVLASTRAAPALLCGLHRRERSFDHTQGTFFQKLPINAVAALP